MYKQDLAINNPQELICHKTQLTNQKLLIKKCRELSLIYLDIQLLSSAHVFI